MPRTPLSVTLTTLAALTLALNAPATAPLPSGLDAPDSGVVCHHARGICYDRYGPSIGLTEALLSRAAGEQLTTNLSQTPAEHRTGGVFSPAEGAECIRESGPCRTDGEVHHALTLALYSPPPRLGVSAEARALTYGEWQWVTTRYNNDTEAQPSDPVHYTLRLERDGAVRVRADCNAAGGQYRLEASTIRIEISHSTLAARPPGSLAQVFLRDLGAAVGYFMKQGQLFLDLQYDTGTMEFMRRARLAPKDDLSAVPAQHHQ